MKNWRKRGAFCSAVALAVSGALLAGSMAQGEPAGTDIPESTSNDSTASSRLSMEEWAALYPLQYNSFATLKTKDWTPSYEGHYSLGMKQLAPIARDGNTILTDENGNLLVEGVEYDAETGRWYVTDGIYDPVTARTDLIGCYSCKTTVFEDLLAESGESVAAEPVTQEFLDRVNGEIWDCYFCHTANPEEGYDADQTLFVTLTGDLYDSLAPEDRVCGQCHNHTYHTPMFTTVDSWSEYTPFKYGYDADSVLQAEMEAGLGTYEESTGITTYRSSHAEMEVTLDSNHHSLGVTCIDCHMPQVTDETTGQTYTDHDASQSPLENEASLEHCLTCHAAQGIESTEDMVQMVRELQDATAERGQELTDKLAVLHGLIEDATTSGTMDEDLLNQARDAYTRAKFYMEWGTFGNGSEYVKVVHDPEEITSLMERSDVLMDEAIALFG